MFYPPPPPAPLAPPFELNRILILRPSSPPPIDYTVLALFSAPFPFHTKLTSRLSTNPLLFIWIGPRRTQSIPRGRAYRSSPHIRSWNGKSSQSPALKNCFHLLWKFIDGKSISLWVHFSLYYDPKPGLSDPLRKVDYSKFFWKAVPGVTNMSIAVPVGNTILLPPNSDLDVIMLVTSTGFSPIRHYGSGWPVALAELVRPTVGG